MTTTITPHLTLLSFSIFRLGILGSAHNHAVRDLDLLGAAVLLVVPQGTSVVESFLTVDTAVLKDSCVDQYVILQLFFSGKTLSTGWTFVRLFI